MSGPLDRPPPGHASPDPRLLDHLRILDLSRGVAGAYCTKLLADAGAEVLKIESAADPDPMRPARQPAEAPEEIERLALFAHLNTAKKSVVLDVTAPDGRSEFLRLLGSSHAVVEDRAPGALAALGLGYEQLRAANRAAVLTSITPFGQAGPYRDYRANDLIVYAMGGGMSTTGIAPRPPHRLAPDATSYLAGTVAAGATLAAVWSSLEGSEGDHIDVAAVDCLLGAPDRWLLMWEFCSVDAPRVESPRPLQSFPTLDGFIAISLSRGVERIARAIGDPSLADDPRFATTMDRQLHSGELEAAISAWTVQRTKREAFDHLQRHEVISAPVNAVEDLFEEPQFKHRGDFVDLEAGGVRLKVPGRPFRAAGGPPAPLSPPPALGEHTVAVLSRPDDAGPRPAAAPPGASRPVPRLPLEGVRVIDFGDAWAGPYGCTLLADAGAEVIRVEDIHRMPANMRGPRVPVEPFQGFKDRDPGERPWERFFLYHGCERNKLGVTLDLKQEAGRDIFLRLVETADVVVSNYAHGVLGSLRLDYADLAAVNPRLIMLYISGFGADGPYADYVALGTTVDAATAHLSLRGYAETTPAETAQIYYPDVATSYTALFTVLAALHRRRVDGRGRHLETALTEAVFPHLGGAIAAYSATGRPPTVHGNRDPRNAPQGCYRTRSLPPDAETERLTESRWIAIACRDDGEWGALIGAMGRADLAADPRFATAAQRFAHHDALDEIINAWTEQRDAIELTHELQAAGVAAMAVMADSDIFADPHIAARGFLKQITHGEAGTFRGPGPLWRSLNANPEVRRPANRLGEHNREVLQGMLGVSDAEFERLVAAEVCGEQYALELERKGQ